jgi:hypothetical protein
MLTSAIIFLAAFAMAIIFAAFPSLCPVKYDEDCEANTISDTTFFPDRASSVFQG